MGGVFCGSAATFEETSENQVTAPLLHHPATREFEQVWRSKEAIDALRRRKEDYKASKTLVHQLEAKLKRLSSILAAQKEEEIDGNDLMQYTTRAQDFRTELSHHRSQIKEFEDARRVMRNERTQASAKAAKTDWDLLLGQNNVQYKVNSLRNQGVAKDRQARTEIQARAVLDRKEIQADRDMRGDLLTTIALQHTPPTDKTDRKEKEEFEIDASPLQAILA